MSVRENVRFGLSVRKLDRAQQDRRIEEVLESVHMTELADRKPNQLSGGQQQRVALARALAVNPACLLLDEPLSNLDAKLRLEMRSEIRRICKSAGYTTIYVTHDQKEALSVADRIAVLDRGRLAQVGTPADLYHRPSSSFVAEFIGQTNLLSGEVIGQSGGHVRVLTKVGEISARSEQPITSKTLSLSIRPEQIALINGHAPIATAQTRNRLIGSPIETTFLGEASEHVIDVSGHRLRVIAAPPRFELPEQIAIEFDPADVVVLPD
jgi:iron(III) transport system ATP-binding protein